MDRTERKRREKDADNSRAYRHRNKNWRYCCYIIMCRLIELRDQLTAHLEAIDEENVSDLDLATTQIFNSEIADLESGLAALEAGPKSVTDPHTKLTEDRMWTSRSLVTPPPTQRPRAPQLSPEDRRRRLLLRWMTVRRDFKRRQREQNARTSLYEKIIGPTKPTSPKAKPTSAKDYSDVIAFELRNILARADYHDRSRS